MRHINILIILLIFFILSSNRSFCQDYKDYIDPKWDKYYDQNPSGISSNFQGSDFIKVIEYVNFIPKRKEIRGDVNLLKRLLLSFDFDMLRQMKIEGDFYSRSKKHDDYFYLYNIYYQKIEKTTWDKYAPYLLPLMKLDDVITLN